MSDAATGAQLKPVLEHIRELKRRVLVVLAVVVAGSCAGYALSSELLSVIQEPLGQKLYYTSPGGGFGFVMKLSVAYGFILALPVIVYHVVMFLSPLIRHATKKSILSYVLWSLLLAVSGVLFAYFVSLPAALHFLTHFGEKYIESLITADAYFSFALTYIGGFAILFQLPLIVAFVNRITPLKPSTLMKGQRYVVVGSFIAAAILTPTPDPFNQLIMALPIILLYQISILMVWWLNRPRVRKLPAVRSAAAAPTAADLPVEPQVKPLHIAADLTAAVRTPPEAPVQRQQRVPRLVMDVFPPRPITVTDLATEAKTAS